MQAKFVRKNRGGARARARKEKELQRLKEMEEARHGILPSADVQFPALRYSPEETERLLQLAYDTIPKRTGKRGTKNLKRQARRWKLVRNIRAKAKWQRRLAHERRMVKRSWVRATTKAVKEAAPSICQKDLAYQQQVLTRWANTMYPAAAANNAVDAGADGSEEESGGGGAKQLE